MWKRDAARGYDPILGYGLVERAGPEILRLDEQIAAVRAKIRASEKKKR